MKIEIEIEMKIEINMQMEIGKKFKRAKWNL